MFEYAHINVQYITHAGYNVHIKATILINYSSAERNIKTHTRLYIVEN